MYYQKSNFQLFSPCLSYSQNTKEILPKNDSDGAGVIFSEKSEKKLGFLKKKLLQIRRTQRCVAPFPTVTVGNRFWEKNASFNKWVLLGDSKRDLSPLGLDLNGG